MKDATPSRRRVLGMLTGLVVAPSMARAAVLAARPVRIIVPFVPGGSSDVVARLLAPRLAVHLGRQFIIENRPGAAGNIAVDLTARATPDGHTLMLGAPGALTVNPLLYRDLRHVPLRDLTPVATIGQLEHAITVRRSFPASDLKGFIDYARAHPDRVTYGSSGVGTTTHLAGALLAMRAGITLKHIGYRGAGQAMTDLIAGHIDAMFDLLPSAIGHIRSGSIKTLATTGPIRAAQLPDVPTAAEAGVPGFVSTSWHALMAPKATPPEIVGTVNAAVNKALTEIEFVERLRALGVAPIPKDPAATTQFLHADAAKWAELIRVARISVETS